MLKIDNQNNIVLTRGDTLTVTVQLVKDGAQYVPEADDVIRIAIATSYVGAVDYELKFSETIPSDTLTITIPASVTGTLEYKTYFYDVEITHGDGAVDTVLSAKLTITGEVK